jgi:hypothetical protein
MLACQTTGGPRTGTELDLHSSGKAWFPWFRFYGPEKTPFDKAWKLPDIEQVN